MGTKLSNIKMNIEKGKLHIEIDLTKELGPTNSDKSVAIAKTDSFLQFTDQQDFYSLNLFLSKRNPVKSIEEL